MTGLLILAGTLAALAFTTGCWLGWQLLRQNGRLLLRIEELERRLDDQAVTTSAATNENERTSRFNNRSLANSKIKRDGLKAGTPAPDFTLPRLDGTGDLSLSELRGKHVLLVFSSPGCGPCNALAPELEKFYRQQAEVGCVTPCAAQRDRVFQNGAQGTDAPYPITVVMISKGEAKENRAKIKEQGLSFPIVLQQQWEISRRYADSVLT